MADDVPLNAALTGAAALGGGPGFTATAALGDVLTELTSFTKFRDHVDELVRDLREGPAGPKQVGQDAMSRAHFGGGSGGWAEATDLFVSYETVISELEKLSTLLSDSIEGMSIAVLASHKGYENVDADVRQRMLAISKDATEHYGGSYEPPVPGGAGRPGGPGGPGRPGGETTKPGDTSGGSGF